MRESWKAWYMIRGGIDKCDEDAQRNDMWFPVGKRSLVAFTLFHCMYPGDTLMNKERVIYYYI